MRFVLLFLFCTTQAYAAADEFSAYIESASNAKLGMNSRWSALIKAAQYANADQQLDQIRKFSSNKDWYMRNASLVALHKVNAVVAMIEAKKLLQDKSLVVRSAAVEILATNLNDENKTILVQELGKHYNFNKKSSLWIRKQIVEKLALSADANDRHFFVKNLFDSDKEIAHLSAKTLSKITGLHIEGGRLVEKWQSIAKKNNWF